MAVEINFTGKSVLVTGGARGLGVDIVKKLYAQGANVFALGKTDSTLQALKQECPNVNIVKADLENWDETRQAVESIGPIDHLVNNAAIWTSCSVLDLSQENLQKMMDVNVSAVLNICQVVAKGMIAKGNGGSIVNISSTASEAGFPGISAYSITKAALDRLTWALAFELGPHQIRANTLNITAFESDMSADFIAVPEAVGALLARTPMGRLPTREEIVNAVLFLLSDLCPMMTGDKIFIDGGYRRA